jgi:uncharacterized protein
MDKNPSLSDPEPLISLAPEVLAAPTRLTPNWKQVGLFLGLTFGLTWLMNLVLYLIGGLTTQPAMIFLQFQMLIPATFALLLGTFVFKESPLYFRTNHTASQIFIYYYLALAAVYLGAAVTCIFRPELAITLSGWLLLPCVLGLILLIVLRAVGGKHTYTQVGLGGGKPLVWVVMGLGLVLFFSFQAWLTYILKLGSQVDLRVLYGDAAAGYPASSLLFYAGFNAVILGPFLGLIIAFGEEFGWRGYLQGELNKLGRKRGTLLLGVIWGIWHWPLIWMGYNYPGQPILGSLLMVGYTIVLAFFLAHAVFKSKGIWAAAYLHALNNQTLSFLFVAVVTPTVPLIFGFGPGLAGLALGGLVVLLLLRDPVWKEE